MMNKFSYKTNRVRNVSYIYFDIKFKIRANKTKIIEEFR